MGSQNSNISTTSDRIGPGSSNIMSLETSLPANLRLNSNIVNKYLDIKLETLDKDRIGKIEEKSSLDIFTPDINTNNFDHENIVNMPLMANDHFYNMNMVHNHVEQIVRDSKEKKKKQRQKNPNKGILDNVRGVMAPTP